MVSKTTVTPFEQLPTLLTTEEVALLTRRSTKSLQNMLGESGGSKPYPAKKEGKHWLIHKRYIKHLLDDTGVERHFK